MSDLPKVAVLGCGHMGLRHIAAYRDLGVEVAAFDATTSALLAAAAMGARGAGSAGELLDDPGIEVVDVCLPTHLHAEVVRTALLRGHHVISEKPLCLNLRQALEIREAEATAGRMVKVGYVYRFAPFIQDLRRRVADGLVGTPRFGLIRLGAGGSRSAWKHQRDQGGGSDTEMLSHALDLALWLFGRPHHLEVGARWQVMPERVIGGSVVRPDSEDMSVARGRFGSVDVVLLADLVSSAPMAYLEIHGSAGAVVVSGPQDGGRLVVRGEPSLVLPAPAASEPWLTAQLRGFLHDFDRGEQADTHTVGDTIALLECLRTTEHQR
ncbi:Gfo/Idh/MocA family oxidoreductase [Micromonosporaceae bacterium B7E4]